MKLILNNKYNWIKYIILFALIYMPLFGHLETFPVSIWDEARLAVSAYEMYKNGNFLVVHFEGQPEMWSTKPPLLIWIQSVFMNIFGVTLLAVRLPSAIAAFLTCLALLIFSVKYLKSFWFGFITVMILITTNGYIHVHGTRTGDYDALLTLFTTLFCLLFFAFIETKNVKYYYLFFIALTLGVLTKGIAGLLFIPGIFIYIFYQKDFFYLLKNKHTYFGLLIFLMVVGAYYIARENVNDGYLRAVWENELGGRYLNTLDEHKHSFWYYFNNLIEFNYSQWIAFVPCGLVISFLIKDIRMRKLALYSILMTFTYFLIISGAETKLQWYDIPMYPFLAIILATFIFTIFSWLRNIQFVSHYLNRNPLPYLFLFLIFINPYSFIWNKTYKPTNWDTGFYAISDYLKKAVKGEVDVNNHFVAFDGYNAHIKFYLIMLNEKGVNINFKNWAELNSGDKVVIGQYHLKDNIQNNYEVEILNYEEPLITYNIKRRIDK